MLSDLYNLLENTVAYAFSDINVIKLKQVGPDSEILKPTEVFPWISTETPLFHLTWKIFPSLFLGNMGDSTVAFS